ncbi:MAG: SRPBCC family protein [Chitinophagales bacterium]
MANYNFITVWKFVAPLELIYTRIYNADEYHIWWKGQEPVKTICSGNELGIGAVKAFCTRSALPYRLNYTGTVLQVVPYRMIEGTTTGDLQGHGKWLFAEENGVTTVKYVWKVETTRFWMNLCAPLLRPLFEWNHDVVMKWGGEGLASYLGIELAGLETKKGVGLIH